METSSGVHVGNAEGHVECIKGVLPPLMLKCKISNVKSISDNTALLLITLMLEKTAARKNILLSKW